MSRPSILNVLDGAAADRPPFWLMRQAGRYLPEYRALRAEAGSFLDLCLDPRMAAEVTMQPVRRFRPDAAILFSDILVAPYGLGQPLRFEEGRGPVLDPVEDSRGLSRLSATAHWARIEPTYETVARVRAVLPADIALVGFAGAPWTVATYMVEGGGSRDYARTKQWLYRDEQGFAALVDLLVEATIRHLGAQVAAGAQIVKLFDSWAGVLAPEAFRRWCVAPVRRIAEAVRAAHPGVPVIGFPRGAGVRYIDFARDAAVDAVAIDTGVPPDWAARELQPLLPVQGNLDPAALAAGGEAMAREVRGILAALSGGPHVFNLGHGVLPGTPPEHVGELARLLRGEA